MDTNTLVVLVCFAAVVGIQFFLAGKGGKVDPLSLAQQLVVDAERLITPVEGETWEQANKRKMDYVIDKFGLVYPGLDVEFIKNLAERGVSLLKNRQDGGKPADVAEIAQRVIEVANKRR